MAIKRERSKNVVKPTSSSTKPILAQSKNADAPHVSAEPSLLEICRIEREQKLRNGLQNLASDDWQMKIGDARTKLKSVYPTIKL